MYACGKVCLSVEEGRRYEGEFEYKGVCKEEGSGGLLPGCSLRMMVLVLCRGRPGAGGEGGQSWKGCPRQREGSSFEYLGKEIKRTARGSELSVPQPQLLSAGG